MPKYGDVVLAQHELETKRSAEPQFPALEGEPDPPEIPNFRPPVVTTSGLWPPTDEDLNLPPRPEPPENVSLEDVPKYEPPVRVVPCRLQNVSLLIPSHSHQLAHTCYGTAIEREVAQNDEVTNGLDAAAKSAKSITTIWQYNCEITFSTASLPP